MKKALPFLPLFALLFVVALFAVPLLSGKDPSVLPSAMIGKPVPSFSLPPAVEGEGLSSDALRSGKTPAVVNVFASWCVTCAGEQKVLAALAETSGVPVYGIVYKDTREAARKWLARHGNPFAATGFDAAGRVSIDWGVYGVPETFVVDKGGVIRHKHVGPLTPQESERTLLPLLERLKK